MLRQIVAGDPSQAKAYELLAYIAGNQGRLDECEALLARAFVLPACSPEACFYLGRVRLQRGRPAEALGPLLRSLERGGEFFEALHEVGVSYSALGDDEAALAFFRRAERLQPRSHELHTNLAASLSTLRRYDEAIAHSKTAIRLEPRWAKAWADLGLTLIELNRLDEALKSFDRALALTPQDGPSLKGRAIALARSGRHAESLEAYRSLARAAPETDYLPGSVLHQSMRVVDWSGWAGQVRDCLVAVDAGRRASAPFALMAVPASSAQLLACARTFAQDICPPVASVARSRPSDPAGRRLRIAYFSADFGEHPTSQLIAGLFEQHDRSRIESFGYAIAARPDGAMHRRIAAGLDHFVDVSARSDAEVASMARAAGIDIAVDLMGFTEGCRPRIFAHRAAPVQIGWLGFPGSMGCGFIDYILADSTLVGPDDHKHYDEKVVTLAHSYQVNDNSKTIATLHGGRAEVGLPVEGFVFACFNGLQKITPPVLDSWVRILRQAAGSVLWLLRSNEAATTALENEARARGLESGRIVWADPLPLAEHLARHAHADLFLDTFDYNAHTTCSDALWAGLPVLTCAGATFASRVSASLLTAAGLPQLITRSPEQYEARAVALAATPAECAELRRHLVATRPQSPLFDTPRFARQLELVYQALADRAWRGVAPAALDVAELLAAPQAA